MPNAPEQQARLRIDSQLETCGWVVQDFKKADFSAGHGIALREVRLKTGPCDYLLIVDRKPVGVSQLDTLRSRLEWTAHQLFGAKQPRLLDELNEALAA